jgi:hypothetical protein
MKKLLFIVLLAFSVAPADAQQQLQALIVSTCGTPPVSYVAGTYGILTMDTTGKLCDGGGGGGGGTQNVNLTQILGAAPSATNQLWVSPATGATFPVSGTFWPYTLGQQLAAASVPVVLTAAQLTTLTPPTSTTPIAGTTGGATPGNEIAPSNTTGVNLKGTPGTVYGVQLGGIGSAPAYLKLYNKATAPTCGTDTPVKRLIIPSAPTAANGAGSNISFSVGINFSLGIGYCVTTGITDADTTAPAANTFLINVDWN